MTPLLRNYVDNYINITPYQGIHTKSKALLEAARLQLGLNESGLLYHLFEGPTTRIIFLGWTIDTEAMTISITPDRQTLLLTQLREWKGKASYTLKELSSLIGL